MHELAITQHMVDLSIHHAARADAARITDVHVVVGQLSGASPECIRFYWDLLAEDTPAHGARLHFREPPLEMLCSGCGARFRPDGMSYVCPACGGNAVRVVAGGELYLEAIDVEHRVCPGATTVEANP